MKYIRDIYAEHRKTGKPVISFEFFPSKTAEAEKTFLEKTVPLLAKLRPDFCSVTYGAGGGTRDKTLKLVDCLQRAHGLTTMCHLTCVNATREQIGAFLDEARALGIMNILALRGDPSAGTGEFQKTPGGFEYARELVTFIRARNGFSVGVAGFPEGHPACKEGKLADWGHLKEKVDAGGEFVMTQLFFDNADFLEFYEHLTKKLGVNVPVSPGILPIFHASQIKRIVELSGARIPRELASRLEELKDDDDAVAAFGIEYATRQCEGLLKAGVPGLHIYTFNKAKYASRILKNLGLA
jgi:methylenetetrahydrofolate reductase (NADPH)